MDKILTLHGDKDYLNYLRENGIEMAFKNL